MRICPYPTDLLLEEMFCCFNYFMSWTYNFDKYLLNQCFIRNQGT